ncbi:hypothetical protein [Ruegeria arenilitoris]|uniref:hypothetical protein n=1 Tax=Ruegeria arenilitoris TaxID=1173585 RepID=UPI00147F8062|nr:hypothetical protein [Ruegeria arenilitoris]
MKRIILLLLFSLLAFAFAYQSYRLAALESLSGRQTSYIRLIDETAKVGCLKKHAFVEVLTSKNLHHWVIDAKSSLESSEKLPDETALIEVILRPNPFLAPPVFTRFYFDEADCWMPI